MVLKRGNDEKLRAFEQSEIRDQGKAFESSCQYIFVNIFIAYAAIWTILEPLISIVSPVGKYISGELKFFVLLFISTLIGLYRSAVPKEITLQYSNSVIKILFGDLFLLDGIKTIPVSKCFFETEVVPTSLQSKVIQFFVQSQEGSKGFENYKENLSSALKDEQYQEIHRILISEKKNTILLELPLLLSLNARAICCSLLQRLN